MREPTLGCSAHKLCSSLFAERRPTPTESVARVRRGVCWAMLQYTVFTLEITISYLWLFWRAGAYRFERLELIHAHIPQRRVPNVNQIQPLSSNFVLRWQRTHAAALTQHCADLIGQDGVGVVQPASSAQALFEAVEDRLIGQQHHQDPQSCRHCGGVEMFFHEHQEPIKAQRSHQLLTRPSGRKSFAGLLLL